MRLIFLEIANSTNEINWRSQILAASEIFTCRDQINASVRYYFQSIQQIKFHCNKYTTCENCQCVGLFKYVTFMEFEVVNTSAVAFRFLNSYISVVYIVLFVSTGRNSDISVPHCSVKICRIIETMPQWNRVLVSNNTHWNEASWSICVNIN